MKKILTLLLLAGAVTTVNAQLREDARRVILGGGNGNNGRTDRDVILGGGRNGDSYPSYPGSYPSSNSRQAEVDRINRDYEAKIQSIRNNRYLSNDEKQRAIRQLERDRQARIQSISNYDRDYNRKTKRYNKGDNGKHKGWYKKEKNKKWKKGKRG